MIGLIISAALAGAANPVGWGNPLTVAEVWARHDELDGKIIVVQGFVLQCRQLSCSLRELPDPSFKTKSLSLGASDQFDGDVQEFLGKRVTVVGKLNAKCLHARADDKSALKREIVICTDRAPELEGPGLMSLAP